MYTNTEITTAMLSAIRCKPSRTGGLLVRLPACLYLSGLPFVRYVPLCFFHVFVSVCCRFLLLTALDASTATLPEAAGSASSFSFCSEASDCPLARAIDYHHSLSARLFQRVVTDWLAVC